MKTAIIIGATSGIGKALAFHMAKQGYRLGLTGRRIELLKDIQEEFGEHITCVAMDVTREDARQQCEELWQRLGNVDIFIYCSGTGFQNIPLTWEGEKETLQVNVLGCAALTNIAYHHFAKMERGHIVVIGSVMAHTASGKAPAYSASKACVANYIRGLRAHAHQQKHPITFTDVQPGFVRTALVQNVKTFWAASAETAATYILAGIEKRKKVIYVTKRWRIVAWIFRLMPEILSRKLF